MARTIGHCSIFQTIDLIQAARLVSRRHQKHIGASFNLVRDGIVISHLDGNFVGELLVEPNEHLLVNFVARAEYDHNHFFTRQPVHDLRDQVETLLCREARNNPDHRQSWGRRWLRQRP